VKHLPSLKCCSTPKNVTALGPVAAACRWAHISRALCNISSSGVVFCLPALFQAGYFPFCTQLPVKRSWRIPRVPLHPLQIATPFYVTETMLWLIFCKYLRGQKVLLNEELHLVDDVWAKRASLIFPWLGWVLQSQYVKQKPFLF